MKNTRLRFVVMAILLFVPLAAAQGAKMPESITNISAEDQKLLQEEAEAFTDKSCVDGTFASVTLPKPPQLTFADALAATSDLMKQQSGKVIKQEATDEAGRMHASIAGVEMFTFSSLVGDAEVKSLSCSVQ